MCSKARAGHYASTSSIRNRLLFTGTTLLMASACAEQPAAVRDQSTATMGAASSQATDLPVVARFQLSLRAAGGFRPATPIQIVAEGRANLPTEGVQIRVSLPEIELSRLSAWGEGFSFEANRVLPAALSTEPRRLERGDSISGAVVVTPLAPGYYSVVATIQSVQSQPLTYEGQWTRNTAVVEAWLFVTDGEAC